MGSWLAQAGQSLHLIGDVLNDRDPKTTAGYAYFQTQRRDALTGHGDKVLILGCGASACSGRVDDRHDRDVAGASDAAQVVSADATASRPRHYLKRETLYDLVWIAPVTEVADALAYRTSRWPSSTAGRRFRSPAAATGRELNLVSSWIDRHYHPPRMDCQNSSGFAGRARCRHRWRRRRDARTARHGTEKWHRKTGTAATTAVAPKRSGHVVRPGVRDTGETAARMLDVLRLKLDPKGRASGQNQTQEDR